MHAQKGTLLILVTLLRQAHAAAAMGGKHDAGVMPQTHLNRGDYNGLSRAKISRLSLVQGNTP